MTVNVINTDSCMKIRLATGSAILNNQPSCTMGKGGKAVRRPRHGVDHPPPSSAKVKESVQLYIYSPSGSFRPCSGVNFTCEKVAVGIIYEEK
jgi:hypothetical protein